MKTKGILCVILFILTVLFNTCEKFDRNNPWDEKADLNPDDWALENLDIEYVSISERTLSWDYSGDERFDGFKIDRKAGEEEWDVAYGKADKDATSWNDDDILPDTTLTYQYRIYAFAGNNNFISSSVSFVPDFPAPTNLKVEKQPDSDIAYKLSWTSNSTGEQGFKIDRKTTGGDWIIAFDSVPGNHTEYVDTNVFLGKSTIDVHYRVYAYYREYETKKISTETQAALPAPSNLEITVNSITSVSLSWQDNSTGEEGFRVERKTAGGQWTEVATVKGNTFDDDEFELNTEIYYRVSAYIGEYSSDYAENSFDSNIPPPSNFQIIQNDITSATLNWQSNSIGNEGFVIQRKYGDGKWEQFSPVSRGGQRAASLSDNIYDRSGSLDGNKEWETLTTTTQTTYTDEGFVLNTQVYYRVAAFYGEHLSEFTENDFNSQIPAPTNAQIEQLSELSYKLSWQDNSNGEQGFKIDRRIDNQPWQMEYAQVGANETSFTDPDVFTSKSAINLQYRVYAYYEAYDSEKATASIQASLSAPSNLEITRNNITSVTLNWQDNSNGELGFLIQRQQAEARRGGTVISERSNQNVVLEANTGLRRTERQKTDDGWETLTTTTETTWIDETFYLDKQVNYRVATFYENHLSEFAVNNFNSSIPSPTNVQLEQLSDICYRITWDYGMQGIDGFRIDRKTGDNPWQIAYAELGKDETEFTDTNVFAGKRNTLNVEYRVYAFFEAYESGKVSVSADAQLTPPSDLEISVNSITSISLSWQDNSTGEEGFKIDRKLGNDDWETGYATVSANETSYADDDVDLEGNHYLYRVYAFYGEYNSAFTEAEYVPLTVTTSPITNISYTSATAGGNVTNDGGFEVTERGVAYGISPNPDISGDIALAEDGLGGFTVEIDGLEYSSTYFVRAYASNNEGFIAYGDNVSFITSNPCSNSITFTYRGEEVTYCIMVRGDLEWMDRNLGADPMPFIPFLDATGNTDTRLYGDLFQWGRLDDGHQDRQSNTTPAPSNTDNPYHSDFITRPFEPHDWRSPQNHNLWQGTSGINNPCPEGWRIPTEEELDAERQSWNSNNSSGAYESTLKWPIGGVRGWDGLIYLVGSEGGVWSSSVSSHHSRRLRFWSISTNIGSGYRAQGASVRCIKELNEESFFFNLQLESYPSGAGSLTGAGSYQAGEEVNIIATANPGWSFVEWTGDITYVADPTSANTIGTMPAQNISLTANFQEENLDFTCGNNITFTYQGDEVTYGTIERGGLCWMDRNLGASRVPISSTDSQGYGDLFQWGRLDDGHQERTSSTIQGPIDQDIPGHDNFITVGSSPWDWRSPQNDELWQGEDGINNPCPEGWRVPTESELDAERQSWESNNSSGAYASTLKWPVGGYRSLSGSLSHVDSRGRVWSSSVSGTSARNLDIYSGGAYMNSHGRADGMSVRCVRDN